MESRIITAKDVSMSFDIDLNRTTSLKEWIVCLLRGKQKHEKFFALNNVTFDVKRGEIIGVIGRNGAGKSTLLKVISGIYRPDKGTVVTAGRVAPLLELGCGFDMELSGRENIYLNGAILGFDEPFLNQKYYDIVDYAELEEFINMPIKTYSSGMLMRLAFSICTIIEPEILIVDEILAVGDERFQRKSRKRMLELMKGGTTVLFVSHSLEQIQELCDRVIWLDQGMVRMTGDTQSVCAAYREFMSGEDRN